MLRDNKNKKLVAPEVYRPQALPKVLQTKSRTDQKLQPRPTRQPIAPPVYRPQPVPKVLQRRESPGLHLLTTQVGLPLNAANPQVIPARAGDLQAPRWSGPPNGLKSVPSRRVDPRILRSAQLKMSSSNLAANGLTRGTVATPFPRFLVQRVIQRMDDSSDSDSPVILEEPHVTALMSFRNKGEGSVIHVYREHGEDRLTADYISSTGKTVSGSYISYAEYNKGGELPDESISKERFCLQNYVDVQKSIRGKGISYVLAYAAAVYSMKTLGHSRVGTNTVNTNSAKLALGLGFKSQAPIQILAASEVLAKAASGMGRFGWVVTGGSLGQGSSYGSTSVSLVGSSSTPLLHSPEPESSSCWGCCFLTTACCRWYGLPDDCEELTLLRTYRDSHLRNSRFGVSAIERYYEIAPLITDAIDSDPNAESIYATIYGVIRACVAGIKSKDFESVFRNYLRMVLELEERYLEPFDKRGPARHQQSEDV